MPILRTVIDATPSGHLTYLVTSFGKPFSENGFGNWMRKRCDEAKAGATIAANRGATEHQFMSMFGWESPKQAAIYTRRANRIRLAGQAMHPLVFDEDEELEATALADLPDEENEN